MLQFLRILLAISLLLTSSQLPAQSGEEHPVQHPTFYRTVQIDGLSIFYREAGPKDAPTLFIAARASFVIADVRTAVRSAVRPLSSHCA
jgi:hypothetical protein